MQRKNGRKECYSRDERIHSNAIRISCPCRSSRTSQPAAAVDQTMSQPLAAQSSGRLVEF